MPPPRQRTVDRLEVTVHDDAKAMGAAVAEEAAAIITEAVAERGVAHVMFATGNSQFAFIDAITADASVPWTHVIAFHMDEYVGVGPDHPAGFRRWIRERIADRVPLQAVHYLDGLADPSAECARYAALLQAYPLDLCCLGVGENGHLAFNDPPVADFDDPLDVKVVELDLACRRQQVGEGHFPTVDDVPARAMTVTVPALLRATRVIAVVPEERKAQPVYDALTGPIATSCPASALRRKAGASMHLDSGSASKLGW